MSENGSRSEGEGASKIEAKFTRRSLTQLIAGGAALSLGVGGSQSVSAASPSDSDGLYRPEYHFTPRDGWMNDPNGLVYHNGTYHLFYQAGENRRRWDHATSENLYDWTEHGTKIDSTESIQAFSGGGVVDEQNTAGFGTDAIVCMYTGHHDDGTEDQRLAYSTDGGESFTKYSDNPVLDTDHNDWRDPVPFWYEPAQEWRMVICRVSAHETSTRSYPAGIETWRSSNLTEWNYLDTYESGDESWECPDLYELPVENTSKSRWVMSMSVNWDHHEFHIGEFDGTSFTANSQFYADDGHDFYAGQSWSNEPSSESRLMTAWMSDWSYAQDMPARGWTGHMTYPRRVTLTDTGGTVVPVQKPDESLSEMNRTRLASIHNETISPTHDPLKDEDVEGQHLGLSLDFDPGTADTVKLRVRENAHQTTSIVYDANAEELIVDRSASGNMFPGTSGGFPETGSVSLSPQGDGTVQLHVLVDSSVIEVYTGGGSEVLSHQLYPDDCARSASLAATGGSATLKHLTAYRTGSESCELGQRLSEDTTYRIRNRHSGLSLVVENASTDDGATVIQDSYSGEAHQQWTAHQTHDGNWYFENENSGKVLDIEEGSTAQGAHCIQRSWRNDPRQKWSLTSLEGDYLHAKNQNSDWALDVSGASTTAGAAAMQWEYWAGSNQKWDFDLV